MNFANVTSLTIPEGSVKAIYCNDVKLWGTAGTYENTITGVPPLTLANCTGDDLVSWSMEGNTVQNGTPSPENPVDVLGTGDWDDTEQKYKIPVKSNDITTNIYIDSPLMTDETLSSEGEREVEWNRIKIKDVTWAYSGTYNRFYGNIEGIEKVASGTMSPVYSDIYTRNIARGISTQVDDNTIYIQQNMERVIIVDSRFSNVSEFVDYVGEKKIVYKIATPTTETFTPPSIPTEQGTTVIDTDCVVAPSEMTVTFMSTTPQNEETR